VFAEEHSQSIVSSFGHVFVCLTNGEIQTSADLFNSTVLNFGANLSPLGEGLRVGRYKLQKFFDAVRQNVYFENRGLTVYELQLSSAQISSLTTDLSRRLERKYPYDFIRHNCGHYIDDWLNGALEEPVAMFYETPRQSLASILSSHTAVKVRHLKAQSELLEAYIAMHAPSQRSRVEDALDNVANAVLIDDIALRFLTLKTAESVASPDEFKSIQAIRKDSLQQEFSSRDVENIIGMQDEAWANLIEMPVDRAEHSLLSIGLSSANPGSAVSSYLKYNMGLNQIADCDFRSSSIHSREIMGIAVSHEQQNTLASVTFISFDAYRDHSNILGLLSSGGSFGYYGIPGTLNSDGLSASFWLGVSQRFNSFWLGARAILSAVSIQDDFSAGVLPGFFAGYQFDNFTTWFEINSDSTGELGWSLSENLQIADGVNVELKVLKPMLENHSLLVGLSFDF
jgi:hypothetical protein